MSRGLTSGPGNRVQSYVESYRKLKKMVLDADLLSTQHYKVTIKDKVEQSLEWSGALPYTSVYWKGSIWVTLNNGHRRYLLLSCK